MRAICHFAVKKWKLTRVVVHTPIREPNLPRLTSRRFVADTSTRSPFRVAILSWCGSRRLCELISPGWRALFLLVLLGDETVYDGEEREFGRVHYEVRSRGRSIPCFFELVKRPDDIADYRLDCRRTADPSLVQAPDFTVEWNGAHPMGEQW